MQGMCQLLLGEVKAATMMIKQAEASRCEHACVKLPGACNRLPPFALLLGITSGQSLRMSNPAYTCPQPTACLAPASSHMSGLCMLVEVAQEVWPHLFPPVDKGGPGQ